MLEALKIVRQRVFATLATALLPSLPGRSTCLDPTHSQEQRLSHPPPLATLTIWGGQHPSPQWLYRAATPLPRATSQVAEWCLTRRPPQEGWEGPVSHLCCFTYTFPSGRNALPPKASRQYPICHGRVIYNIKKKSATT